MNRFIKNPKWLIRGALLAVILAFFAWIYGWGGGDIQVMNFTAEDVERLTVGLLTKYAPSRRKYDIIREKGARGCS